MLQYQIRSEKKVSESEPAHKENDHRCEWECIGERHKTPTQFSHPELPCGGFVVTFTSVCVKTRMPVKMVPDEQSRCRDGVK